MTSSTTEGTASAVPSGLLRAICTGGCGEEILVRADVPEELRGKPRRPMCKECAKAHVEGKARAVIHRPGVAKHPWRIDDGLDHPVTVTTTESLEDLMQNLPKINLDKMTDAQLGAVVRKALLDMREDKATKGAKKAKAKAKIEATADLERKIESRKQAKAKQGSCPAFTFQDVSVPELDLSEGLDETVSPLVRKPYNKVGYRLEGATIPTDITKRGLIEVHQRLMAAAGAKATAVKVDTKAKAKGKKAGKKAKGKKVSA